MGLKKIKIHLCLFQFCSILRAIKLMKEITSHKIIKNAAILSVILISGLVILSENCFCQTQQKSNSKNDSKDKTLQVKEVKKTDTTVKSMQPVLLDDPWKDKMKEYEEKKAEEQQKQEEKEIQPVQNTKSKNTTLEKEKNSTATQPKEKTNPKKDIKDPKKKL